MAIIKTDDKHYKNIASKIRDYAQTEDTYKPEEMANGIIQVYEQGSNEGFDAGYDYGEEQGFYNGFDIGYNEGEAIGYMEGRNSGLADGKEQEKADFWNLYQHPINSSGGSNGNTRMFSGVGWNSTTFYPQYDIDISYSGVFYYFDWWGKGLDLVERLNECKVKLDSSKGVGDTVFCYAWVKTVPKITVLTATGLSKLFQGAQILQTIEELALPEENDFPSDNWKYTFQKCNALRNIVITGMIANTVSFNDCSKLTADSVLGKVATAEQIADKKNIFTYNGVSYYGGIFGALKDYSGTNITATLNLNTTVIDWLKSDYPGVIDLVKAKGWTIA